MVRLWLADSKTMQLPTWKELLVYHSSNELLNSTREPNPLYEPFADRRYNYGRNYDISTFRLVFSKRVTANPRNKTLFRKGRFIWCKSLKYEGLDEHGMRQVSFTIDKGKKRFCVSEVDVLCLPAKSFINNSKFMRDKYSTYMAFSTVFAYEPTLHVMAKEHGSLEEFKVRLRQDSPWKPGTLIAPRKGYFHPGQPAFQQHVADGSSADAEFPYGIILARGRKTSNYYEREFYRVRFGQTTYDRVTPIQMEIVSEI